MMYRLLFYIQAFVGIGAMAGGLGGILNPQAPMGTPVELLKNTPFSNYFIPGVILFTVIGLGNVFSALMLHFKSKYRGYISSIFSWALVIWIVVQCIMLNVINYLHVIFFFIGLIEVILSTRILFKESLWPANVVRDFYKNKIESKKNDSPF